MRIRKKINIFLVGLLLLCFTACSQQWNLWTINSAVYTSGQFAGFYQWSVNLPSEWSLIEENGEGTEFKTQLGELSIQFSLGEIDWDRLDQAGILVYDMAEKIQLVNGDVMYLRFGTQNTFLYQATDEVTAEFVFTKSGSFSLSDAKKTLNTVFGSLTLLEKDESEEAEARYRSLPRFVEGETVSISSEE